MPPKTIRKYTPYKSKKGKNPVSAATTIQKAVRAYLNKNIETKKSNVTSNDNIVIGHNGLVYADSNVLLTTQGVTDPAIGNGGNRIGDEINLKGVSMKFMLENNHRYSDVTFRIFVVKSAKGDVPTTSTLFNGLSGNKMMDTLNTERFTILHSKYVKIKQSTAGGDGALGTSYIGSGLYDGDASLTQSASTKIVSFYIPGRRFVGKRGIVKYEGGTTQTKFFDFTVLIYAYAVGATSEALGWNVGVLNEYVKVMYFKDA